VGDQRPVAALGQVGDAGEERVGERAGRRLEQDPAARAERHPAQLHLAEALDRGLRHLAAAEHRHRQALLAQTRVELLNPAGDLLDPHVVVVADVRRRADPLYPVVSRLARQADAVGQVEGAVVDAGEDVAMQVDQGANSVSGTGRRWHRTTIIGMIQHLLPPGLWERMGFN